jgi:hypothetical protein
MAGGLFFRSYERCKFISIDASHQNLRLCGAGISADMMLQIASLPLATSFFSGRFPVSCFLRASSFQRQAKRTNKE